MKYLSITAGCLAVYFAATAGGALVAKEGVTGHRQEADAADKGTAATADGGTISGKVKFARKTRLRKKEFANVVVSVEDVESTAEELKEAIESRPKASINQKDLAFHPHVLPVLVGETVHFPNSDPLFHNVYSQSKVKVFNLGMYPKGSSKDITFDGPGLVELRCNVHAEMQAFILIKKNPYFATVKRDGTFRIENVPAGPHRIQVWHPKTEPVDSEVTVESGKKVDVDLELTKRRGRKG